MEYLMDNIGGWLQSNVLFAAMITLVTVWLAVLARSKSSQRRLPPGPRGWPIVGSLFSLDGPPHEAWEKLSKKYGPIMFMKLGSAACVIVSTPELAEEVLKTKDSVTATRPDKTIAANAMWAKESFFFGKIGPTWRIMRKLCTTELFTPRRLQTSDFQSFRKTEILATIRGVLHHSQRNGGKPVNITELMQRQTFNNITQMVMGKRFYATETASNLASVENIDLEGCEIFIEYATLMGKLNIGDFISFLRPLDLQGVKKQAVALGQKLEKYLHTVFDDCHKSLDLAESQNSVTKGNFVEHLVKLQPENIREKERPRYEYLSDDEIKGLVLDLTIGGTDTSSGTLVWTLAELVKNPHMMKRVQAELDNVVGRDRLVEEADISKLSYLQAVVKEVLRVHPIAPRLAPHYTIEDCELGGYSIPANTQVIVNAWAIHRNPALWERPLEFDPDRFLRSNIEVGGQNFKYLPFGSGRRVCPGYILAMIMVQYPLAQLCHSFDWKVPDGQKPEDLDMSAAGALGLQKVVPLMLVPKLRLPASVIQQRPT